MSQCCALVWGPFFHSFCSLLGRFFYSEGLCSLVLGFCNFYFSFLLSLYHVSSFWDGPVSLVAFPGAGIDKLVLKGQAGKYVGLWAFTVFVGSTQLCRCNMKAAPQTVLSQRAGLRSRETFIYKSR